MKKKKKKGLTTNFTDSDFNGRVLVVSSGT